MQKASGQDLSDSRLGLAGAQQRPLFPGFALFFVWEVILMQFFPKSRVERWAHTEVAPRGVNVQEIAALISNCATGTVAFGCDGTWVPKKQALQD